VKERSRSQQADWSAIAGLGGLPKRDTHIVGAFFCTASFSTCRSPCQRSAIRQMIMRLNIRAPEIEKARGVGLGRLKRKGVLLAELALARDAVVVSIHLGPGAVAYEEDCLFT